MSYTENETVIPRNIEEEMKESYLRYSLSVIISRALPDVRDGLKPSQRRILYAMRQLNLSPGAKFRKCAKICGDTSGDFHPHGESVIYPTLVRMAQDWAMRYTLVQGQGNFGSIDGDAPAAMRYAEARLTHSAMNLMADLDKDTVEMVPNYDETQPEPTVFPAKYPNLLCNGSTGIAVGMATNIPTHNISEVIEATKMLIDNPTATVEDIIEIMPGPDFPTGGSICGFRGIHEAYHTGRGKLTVRATMRVEDMDTAGEKQRIVVDEVPYNVNKSRLIEHIAGLITAKTITGVSDLRDESDRKGMRIVLELKRGEIPDVIINQLYKYSDMQVTFGCNMLALDKGMPRTMNVKQMIAAWIEHRIDVIRRRTRFELNKAEARAHILEGYLKAIDNLDEVVRMIRQSPNKDQAKAQLIERFGFSDRQAKAVLELRLYQLTGLEHDKISEEYQGLLKTIERLSSLLGSEGLVRDLIKQELDEVKAQQKSERKTRIIAAEGEFNMEDLIADETVFITISNDDYVRRLPLDTFREQRRGGTGIIGMDMRKETDALKDLYVASTHDHLLIFTTLGRCYWLKVWQIPETGRRSKGKPLVNLLEDIQPGEGIATTMRVRSLTEEGYILFATRKGTIKKTAIDAFSNPRRKGVYAISIDEDDELIGAHRICGDQQIMLFTKKGMAVRFDHEKTRAMGRTARGVRGVRLKSDDDIVVGCEVVSGDESILVVCENGYGKRSAVEEFRQTNRGGSGVRSIVISDRNGDVVGAVSAGDNDGVIMMSSGGQAVRIHMRDTRVMGRATQGVRLANLRKGDTLVGIQKIPDEEGEPEEQDEGTPDND